MSPLALSGQTGALIAAHDWVGTPLGPIGCWRPCLRTALGLMLNSPVPMAMLWGEDGIMLYNDAYAVIAGERHPQLLGCRVRDGWPELAAFNDHVMKAVLAGGTLVYRDQALTLLRHGRPEQVFFNLDYSPVPDDEGRPAGVIAIVVETTARVIAERRRAFRLDLQETLRPLTDPRSIMDSAVTLLGRHLGAARVGYTQVQADGETILCESCYVDGVEPVAGIHRLDRFGVRPSIDRVEVCNDLALDASKVHASWRAIDTRALVSVPLVRDGQLSATLYVNFCEPRPWTAEEVALIEDVARRTWDAVERAMAEKALRESETRLRLAVEAGRLAEATVHIQGGDARVIHSAAFAEMLGHPADKRLSLDDIHAQYHPDDVDRVLSERQALLDAGGENYESQHRMVLPDGRVRWLYGRGRINRDDHGRPVSVTALYLDDTERRANEEALRKLAATLEQQVVERTAQLRANQAHLRAAFETSYGFQGLLSREGLVLDANRTSLASIQCERDEVINRPFWDTPWFTGTPGMPEVVRAALEHVAQGVGFRREIRIKLGDSWHWFDFSMRPIHDASGEVTGIVPEAVETTERRVAEEALRQSQKLEAMGQLTGGVAHDFNNLLTPILGGLDMLQRREVGGPRERRIIDGALQSAERARVLVQRLLAFSRRQPLQPMAVDVARLIDGMADLVDSTLGPQIRVAVQLDDQLPAAHADPNQLEMALLNLAVNARDAMPEGGLLRISAEVRSIAAGEPGRLRPGDYVRLSVRDSGIGMDEATVARAIEPFFSTKGIGKGTGLGLSMVHGLASQLGGELRLSSSPGEGTQVELWLPVSADRAVATACPRTAPTTAATAAGTVLLVDDEELVRASSADMLTELGYAVVEVHSAELALDLIDAGLDLDVLVTDHLMPGMSGTQLVAAIRQRRSDVPVLLVSGYAEMEGLASGLPCLTKPFRKVDLAASLATLVQAPPHAASSAAAS